MNGTSNQLVEHFFRHESANLIAVLTRAFGVQRFDLVEDTVQSAMLEAMHTWKQKGPPDNPAAWIHRVAKNRILDRLRRDAVHERALAFAGQSQEASEALVDQWLQESELPDSLLKMIFVCCHPTLDRSSQIALTLKVLCGFGIGEISRALLMQPETIKKRIQRAKAKLAKSQVTIESPSPDQRKKRLNAVHDVLYLIFNEGYSTSHGHEAIRDDLCEEAARLCHLLCLNEELSTPTTRALLALMLFHGARLDARIDSQGTPILLEDQDRNRWDHSLIKVAECWLTRSNGDEVSRFHFEAAIAQQHCQASSVEETDWQMIVGIYDRLISLFDSPIYILNRAIALGQLGETDRAMSDLDEISTRPGMSNYFLIECAKARLFELADCRSEAIDCYLKAMSGNTAAHEKSLLKKKIQALSIDKK